MSIKTVQEPLRDRVGRVIFECDEEKNNRDRPGWYDLNEDRREPWRRDADRVLTFLRATGMLGETIEGAARSLIGLVRLSEHDDGRPVDQATLSLEIALAGGGVEAWEITVERTASSH